MAWTLATAKNQLSEVVRRARSEGPQTISVRGCEAAVVVSQAWYEARVASARDLKSVLASAPKVDFEPPPRVATPPRDPAF